MSTATESTTSGITFVESEGWVGSSLPAAAFVASLIAAQYAGIAIAAITTDVPTHHAVAVASAKHDLFDELLAFHERLASSQRQLPEIAARVLQQNPWELYD